MITIKHQGRRWAAAAKKFKKFNFLFNINYLFYLFKHRILIILNSPRVFALLLLFLPRVCCLTNEILHLPLEFSFRRKWRKSSMRNFSIHSSREVENSSVFSTSPKKRKLFLCKARHFPSLLVFPLSSLPFSAQTMGNVIKILCQ